LTCAEALELATTTTGAANASAPTAARSGRLRCHFFGNEAENLARERCRILRLPWLNGFLIMSPLNDFPGP
jgi:hypothetical protein